MSYYRRDGRQSRYLVDQLPVYVFPAFVGSGRMLLGVALAGLTTAALLHTAATREPLLTWLGVFAYLASLWLVISGIYAVNVVPPPRPRSRLAQEPTSPPPPRRPVAEPLAPPLPDIPPPSSRLADLLAEHWNIATPEQLARARRQQDASGRSLVFVLAQSGLLTDEKLERVLEHQSAALDPWHDAPRHD